MFRNFPDFQKFRFWGFQNFGFSENFQQQNPKNISPKLFSTLQKMFNIFLEQHFRPTTFIPDACGGCAANNHTLIMDPRGRRRGAPSKNDENP